MPRLTALLLTVVLVLAACQAESPSPPAQQEAEVHTSARYPLPDTTGAAQAPVARGQVLYVAVYSHIFAIDENRTSDLTATLSIRNTSLTDSIAVDAIDYYDSDGSLLKTYLEEPRHLGPLSSTYVVIAQRDRSGGVGANFIVSWSALYPVTPPMVEAVMLSTSSSQGISFTSGARVLQSW